MNPSLAPWRRLTERQRTLLAVVSIIAVSVGTYLPAVDNTFISDDFGLFRLLKALERDPFYIFEATSELFRVMSYLYFWICFKVFGMTAEPFYWTGIALHTIVSVLVYALTLSLTRWQPAAWAAALFFAAYERHQEAVMWISAANETVLTVNCLLFLLLWNRAISREEPPLISLALAMSVFALALFSKEAAVVLAPLAVLSLLLRGYSRREIVRLCLPLVIMLTAFVSFWLSQAHRNFFVTDGHYSMGMHFFPVYARTLIRLLSPAIPFVIALVLMKQQWVQRELKPAAVFFAVLLVLSIAPYSFLTYLDHLPSRNTYLPSVGLAGLIGVLFATLYGRVTSAFARKVCVSLFLTVVTLNIAYVWLKKEPQYRERAAPTRELIDVLNSQDIPEAPIYVCDFPLHPVVFSEAVTGFTRFSADDVVFLSRCEDQQDVPILRWDEEVARYVADFR